MAASFGGDLIFGGAVRVRHVANPPAEQVNAFFGIGGLQSLYGGSRGRTFLISGVLAGTDDADLSAAEANLNSYVDGIARVLVDTRGRSWPSVILRPPEVGQIIAAADGSRYLPYQMTALGLL